MAPLGLNFMYLVDVHLSRFGMVVLGVSHFDQMFALVYNSGLPPAVCVVCLLSVHRKYSPELGAAAGAP